MYGCRHDDGAAFDRICLCNPESKSLVFSEMRQVTEKTGKLTSASVPFVSALAALEPKDGDEMAIPDMVVSVSTDKGRKPRAMRMPVFESQVCHHSVHKACAKLSMERAMYSRDFMICFSA